MRRLVLLAVLLAVVLAGCGAAPRSAQPAAFDLEGALSGWAREEDAEWRVTRIDPRPLRAPVRIGETPRVVAPIVGLRARRPIDVSFERAPLPDALRMLADAAGVGLVIGEGVTGDVSLTLRGVQPLEAMRALAEAHGVSLTFVGRSVIARGL